MTKLLFKEMRESDSETKEMNQLKSSETKEINQRRGTHGLSCTTLWLVSILMDVVLFYS